jgi:hypothetical protein
MDEVAQCMLGVVPCKGEDGSLLFSPPCLFNSSFAPARVKGFSNPLTISGRWLLRVPRRMGKRIAASDLKKGNLSFSPHSFANYFSCT